MANKAAKLTLNHDLTITWSWNPVVAIRPMLLRDFFNAKPMNRENSSSSYYFVFVRCIALFLCPFTLMKAFNGSFGNLSTKKKNMEFQCFFSFLVFGMVQATVNIWKIGFPFSMFYLRILSIPQLMENRCMEWKMKRIV